MNIENVKMTQLKMPLKSKFETSFGSTTVRDFLLVSVDGDGKTGYCESVAMPDPMYNEETTETVINMLKEHLIPKLKGESINHPSEISQIYSIFRRNQMAKSSIEGAIWDLYGKQKNITLASALGGTRTSIDVGVSIGIESTIDA